MKQSTLFIITFWQILFFTKILYGQNWHSIGPSAAPVSICVSDEYILIGTSEAGIVKSTDNGLSWKYVKDMPPKNYGDLNSIVIMCIKQDPNNSNLVYAGTGPNETATGHGFFKSTDGGETWKAKNKGLPPAPAIQNISINPFNTSEIYLYCRGGNNGIFKSTDQGETWSLFFNDTYLYTTLIFDPTDSTTKYAIGIDGTVHKWINDKYEKLNSTNGFYSTGRAIQYFINPISKTLFYVNENKISKWNGSKWESLARNIPATNITINSAGIEQKHGIIFLCTNKTVYQSTDDGSTWNSINDFGNMCVGIGTNKIVLTGFHGIYLSDVYARQWSKISDGPPISYVYNSSITFSEHGNAIYLIGMDRYFTNTLNLFKTTDDGLSWAKLKIPNEAIPTVVKTNPLNPDIVYVGCGEFYTAHLGLYKSCDGGNNWQQILPSSATPVTYIDIPANDTGRIILGCPGIIYESKNSGKTWKAILGLPGSNNETNSVKVSERNPATICVASSSNNISDNGFYVTNDSGYHWERRVDGLIEGLSYTNISTIAIHPENDSIIFIGNAASVFKSTNQGLSWETCNFPDFNNIGYIKDIQFVKNNPDWIFVTVRGTQIGKGGLFFTRNGGESWNEILLPDTTDKAMTFLNLFPSKDKLKIYAGTNSYGCYLGEIPMDISSTPEGKNNSKYFTLYQNYPNPFNPATTITYSLPKSSLVIIKIYDLLGKEITTLVNEEKQSGTYQVTWDAKNIPSGIYFYKITAGEFSKVSKMILLR